jgi:hypothetical protein
MPFENELKALAAAATGSLSAAIPASGWAHHGHAGESLWHDVSHLLSTPGLVLLIAAAVVGVWVVVKRLRHTGHTKS